MTANTLSISLESLGLTILGTRSTETADLHETQETLYLVGPEEPRFWSVFTASPEYTDRKPDPLDRWSRRVLTDIAERHHGEALFPFGGPPFEPFQTWAMQTGRFWPSPIGFLVHDTAGLFASFRGAILLTGAAQPTRQSAKPCDTCIDQPCTAACPVNAFADGGYDVAACKAHVRSAAGQDCLERGCRARDACPVGQGNRLPAQAAFHMKAFL